MYILLLAIKMLNIILLIQKLTRLLIPKLSTNVFYLYLYICLIEK
jgi:hypothetical protein